MNFPDNILAQTENFVEGMSITSHTLVGCDQPTWPHKRGNCFSMCTTLNQREFKIVNFYYENMQELVCNRGLQLPVRLYILGDPATSHVAAVYDTGIEESWYATEFCRICTPNRFLSFTQLMHEELCVEGGWMTRFPGGTAQKLGPDSGRPDHRTAKELKQTLQKQWTMTQTSDIVVVQ